MEAQQQPQQQQQQQQQLQQQQLQHQYQYQYQTTQNNVTTSTIPQSYDPSTQIQSYDQSSTQIQSYDQSSYYAAAAYAQPYGSTQPQQPYQTNIDYSSSYYYPDYSNAYQIHDPNSIHPPGVSVSFDPQQTHVPIPQNLYYQSPQIQGYLPPSQPVYRGGGSQGGRSLRGAGHGAFGRHGRGRGGGRGKNVAAQTSVSSALVTSDADAGQGVAGKPPPRLAWCELCRVDCTTVEILEQHRNGKKHKRNLKVFDELQNLSRQLTVQNSQSSLSQLNAEGSNRTQISTDPVASASAHVENKTEPSVVQPFDFAVRQDSFSGRGGLKRKMRGGRGGKWIRASDGTRKPVEPKQVVPLFCHLCNVKCESQVVFESHIAGKKHLSNAKRFEGHKEVFGEGVQALYPTIPNLPPASITSRSKQQGSQDAHALASMMLSQQNLPDPQAAQVALAQLLNQHGINDAQTLISQLVPHLLAQLQAPASASLPAVGLSDSPLQFNTQAPPTAAGAEGQNAATEITTEQQNASTLVESDSGAGSTVKSDDGLPETTQKVGAA